LANCNTAGDKFCDTESDYIGNRWNCFNTTITQTDINGDRFRIDSSLYMSYSSDICQNRFTGQQNSAIRYTVNNLRPYLLGGQVPAGGFVGPISNLVPVNGTGNIPRNFVRMTWSNDVNATHYLLQVSSSPSFANLVIDFIIKDTTYLYTGWVLIEGNTYYYRVKPYNLYYTCASITNYTSFSVIKGYGLSTSENDINSLFQLKSNLVSQNSSIEVLVSDIHQLKGWKLLDISGKTILNNANSIQNNEISIPTDNIQTGIYFIEFINKNNISARKKLVIY
jgi:hypothetical protein